MPANAVDTSQSANAFLRPVPIESVRLTDRFWQPRRRINRELTIPSQHQQLESTHRIDNFRVASAQKTGEFVGAYYNDSDVYKWLEAAASTLDSDPDGRLKKLVDDTIDAIAPAQQPDGYLNTYFMFDRAGDRWTNLKDKHELYCAGHLIQAAIAHHRATGDERLLRIATRFADHICRTFGPAQSGRREGTCGHPEIEMSLVELFRATGERRYLDQAIYFLDSRGRGLIGGGDYYQDRIPVRKVARVTGHAVRQIYLTCGMTDACLETNDPEMRAALDRLWSNMTQKHMYVTGGLGARHEGEAFGDDFELPNKTAYAETCAAIANVMWNWRMLLLTGESRYADVMELALYNGVLSGVSLDGQKYFYVNPLEDDAKHRRQEWFGCACCPPNIARLLAQLPGYFYSTRGEHEVFVHHFASSIATLTLGDGRSMRIEQITRYPWEGDLAIRMLDSGQCTLRVRKPSWCGDVSAVVPSPHVRDVPSLPGEYVTVDRDWRAGDELRVKFSMEVRQIPADPRVVENAGRVAIAHGPLIYCAEAVDNPGVDLTTAAVRSVDSATQSIEEGIVKIAVNGLSFIPYYSWANRAPGGMKVWF